MTPFFFPDGEGQLTQPRQAAGTASDAGGACEERPSLVAELVEEKLVADPIASFEASGEAPLDTEAADRGGSLRGDESIVGKGDSATCSIFVEEMKRRQKGRGWTK